MSKFLIGKRIKRMPAKALVWGLISVVMMAVSLLFWSGKFKAAAEFLQPDLAFQFSAQAIDDHTIAAIFDIADGYYLYRERFKFSAEKDSDGLLSGTIADDMHGSLQESMHESLHQADALALGEAIYPKGKIKFDETFQKNVEYFRHRVVVLIPLRTPVPTGKAQRLQLKATYQGCADAGLCYAPIDKLAAINLATPVALFDKAATRPDSAPNIDESSRITSTLRSGKLWAIAAIFTGLGVLLSFTPCVLPMLPILSAIIVGHAPNSTHASAPHVSRRRGLALAAAYSLGMALVYTALGIAAGLAGEGLAAALQNVWMLSAFALLLVLLSLSMFGVYALQIPPAWQARLTQWSWRLEGGNIYGNAYGKLGGTFLMGALSALIVGPCVAAPLAGTLIYISQTRNVLIGGLALFSLAVGMSVPLLLLGASAGSLLPRAGAWMNGVKRLFGVLLLAVAYWIVMPVLPQWARITTITMAPALGPASQGPSLMSPIRFERVRTNAELDQILRSAGQPVLLDFYADWCVACIEMERYTYTDVRVTALMKHYRLLQVDVTANTDADKLLLKRFELFGPPGILFFDRNGLAIEGAKIIGFQNADLFLKSLQQIGH